MTSIVPLDPRVNPGFLKLDLLCRGARLVDPETVEGAGGRPVLRTRAGLGSGLELVLQSRLHVNVPVVEAFASESPYEVEVVGGEGRVDIRLDGAPCARARLAPRPRWYDRPTSRGRPMRRVGTLQGTYLAIYPGRVCDFWVRSATRPEKENCRFCSVGLNLGADDASDKSVDEVMEVVLAARRESRISYVDFNAGHADDAGFLDALEPYLRRVKRETGLLVGVQTPPHPDPSRWAALRAMGVNRVSFCFELFDPVRFAEVCPGKARVYGQRGYFDAIEECLRLATARHPALEPWVVNGEIVAGLESPEKSVEAIEWLTSRGAVPTVCVFRPLSGTDLATAKPPATEEVLPVFQALYERCAEAGLPIGLAPNVHVSLVMLPEECRWLLADGARLKATARHRRGIAMKRPAVAGALWAKWAWRSAMKRPPRVAMAPLE